MKMKKMLFCLSSLLLLPGFILGSFGVKAGLNFNRMANAGTGDSGPLTAWRLGGDYMLKLSEKLSLRPEIFLSQTGTRDLINLFGETFAVSEKYLYIEVPLMVAYTFFFKRGLSMGIEAGGYGAYNLVARQTLSGPDGDHGGSIRNGISKLDLGAVLGLELAKKMGRGEWILNLRFQEGLVNINKSAPYYPEMRNRIIALLLGYRFGR